jgi:hypothetical protein
MDKMMKRMQKQRKRIDKMMATAPFRRRMDKCAYVFGTTIIVLYSYLIGKFPHTVIYGYVTVLMTALLLHRYYSYYTNGYHMYLLDFCYTANFGLLILLNFAPNCQWLLITCYLQSQGPLAAAIAAFRNSLVYHRVDMLTSLAIHAIPMTLTLHIRWDTVPNQADLPLDEQRFAPFPDISTWDAFFDNFFKWPLAIYFVWLFVYGVCNFILTSKVADYTYESSYSTFTQNPELKKKFTPLPTELVFLGAHFLYYFALHCWAVLLFHCYWLNMLACVCWLLMSTIQGANYYMDYFCKKYEAQLTKLSVLEAEVESTPTLVKQTSFEPAPDTVSKKTQ